MRVVDGAMAEETCEPRCDRPRPCGLVILSRDQAGAVLERLAAGGVDLVPAFEWGDSAGYVRLQQSRPPLILLDLPRHPGVASLLHQVNALGTLGPVVVLTSVPVDIPALLDAGAYDVLDRGAQAVELAARIGAHARRLSREIPVSVSPQPASTSRPAQRFLLQWLQDRSGPFCCHDLRWLLGPPGRPLSLATVRRRLARVVWLLREQGLDLRERRLWGTATYHVVKR